VPVKNAINWFEIPATDFKRATGFYGKLFGADLHHVKMGEADMGFLPADREGVGGAVICGPDARPAQGGVTVYLNANPDLSAVLARVAPAGGTVLVPKTPISPEFGFFAIFTDTEGNTIGLHSNA
jgi:predicted enzyme related to lactoylglutathione lyase